jgi:hypothetical protein
MAVELCKVALWMEALEPGRPLSFLDAHIKCGNSLLGATPDLIAAGIPDDAFKRIEGVAPSASVGMDDPDPGFCSPPFTAGGCSDPPRHARDPLYSCERTQTRPLNRAICRHFTSDVWATGLGHEPLYCV